MEFPFFAPETSTAFAMYVQSVGQLEVLYHRQFDSLEQFADRHIQYLQSWPDRSIPKGVNSTIISESGQLVHLQRTRLVS